MLRFSVEPPLIVPPLETEDSASTLRNINSQKCHEFFLLPWACAFLFTALSITAPAQIYRPPFVPPPSAAAQANPANPNQKVRVPRPNAPGPKDLNVDADKQEVEGSRRHFRGNVRLETTDMLLLADEVDYDADTGDAQARGNVKFEHFFNGDRIECDHADYNLDEETGKFYDRARDLARQNRVPSRHPDHQQSVLFRRRVGGAHS